MKLHALALALAMAAAAPALAHAPKIGPHGGQQTDAGNFHVEIVPNGSALDVYLTDHGFKPVSTEGFKGVAIFKGQDGAAVRIPLAPSGDNRLNGAAPAPLPAALDGAVQIVTRAGVSATGKFAADAATASAAPDHKH